MPERPTPSKWKIVAYLLALYVILGLAFVGLACIMGSWFHWIMRRFHWVVLGGALLFALFIFFGWKGKDRIR